MAFILAFDQGTTSSRSMVFDHDGRSVKLSQKPHRQIYPQPGWVEHDPVEIWQAQIYTATEAIREFPKKAIRAVGITNQRETTVIWERDTGLPIYNAIVWQDRRTAAFCDKIKAEHANEIKHKTGLEVDAYFSASKVNWLLNNIPGARERAEDGELAFGTIDSWLVWKLTNGREHVTDVSNASRTMLFNINSLEWDNELLSLFDVPKAILPEIRSSSEVYGAIEVPEELSGITIGGIAGDQQAALFGQTCFLPGSVKNTYGTGCFMLQNTGDSPATPSAQILSTVGWKIGRQTTYAIEGSVFIGGAVVEWLRDGLKIIKSSSEAEELANSVDDSAGVYFVPAFSGLGTPHWDQDARGLIIGLTRSTTRAHIAKAAIRSIAFQTADLLDALCSTSGVGLHELRVDGGAARNDSLLQFQADILQLPVVRPEVTETTALGAAYLAGLAVDFWSSTADLEDHWTIERRFVPLIEASESDELRERWKDAVGRSLRWHK